MIQALIITFREGVEAFLIVAISISYLRKTGREHYLNAVYWAIGVSLATSVLAGYLFSLASNQAFWEGALAVLASILVGSMVVHMWRVARTLKISIHSRIDKAVEARSVGLVWWGIFSFIVLMITREGMEMALLMGTLMFQVKVPMIVLGAMLGIVMAAIMALAWSRYGHRINLGLFLQVTALFLLVFVVQLLMYGIHELSEADLFPLSTQIHDATESLGPDGIYGKWLSFFPVIVPLGWLVYSWASRRIRWPLFELTRN